MLGDVLTNNSVMIDKVFYQDKDHRMDRTHSEQKPPNKLFDEFLY